MPVETQTFENHAKTVPLYHRVAFPIFALNVIWSIVRLIRQPSWESAVGFLLAVALVLLFFYARIFALTVQDRVIRLEMRLRLQEVLPPELRSRIGEFQVGQLVALRFASDAELPELARKVLEEKITDRTAIKKMIRDWQPDELRA